MSECLFEETDSIRRKKLKVKLDFKKFESVSSDFKGNVQEFWDEFYVWLIENQMLLFNFFVIKLMNLSQMQSENSSQVLRSVIKTRWI